MPYFHARSLGPCSNSSNGARSSTASPALRDLVSHFDTSLRRLFPQPTDPALFLHCAPAAARRRRRCYSMVYCGKASTGCQNCRTRRIKVRFPGVVTLIGLAICHLLCWLRQPAARWAARGLLCFFPSAKQSPMNQVACRSKPWECPVPTTSHYPKTDTCSSASQSAASRIYPHPHIYDLPRANRPPSDLRS